MTTAGVLPRSDCLVLVNPSAAAVDATVAQEIEGWLSRRARTVRTVWTEAPGHATELAREHADAGLVITVGGDGTVSELVQGMAGHQILCALPVGSGNSTVRNLFGDRSWRQVLDLLDDPGAFTVRRIDLLRLAEPGVTAVLGASTGFMAQVLRDARAVDPAVKGIDRYFTAAVGVLQAMPDHPTRVTVDGTVVADGPMASVAIGGGRFRAWSFQFLPESLLDDGLLDVCGIDALNPAAVAELVPLMATGQYLGRPDVRYARGTSVIVERTDGLPLVAEFDGSVWDAAGARLSIEIVPNALLALAATDGPRR
ncbi:MAG TPA: diacylglycerol kinase family protein [Streptosporangiaceae bacterium]|nr:diacylglycerol kinase family protein [Streptosporangiaceae bacterium]